MRIRNILFTVLFLCSFSLSAQVKTEKWKIFELTLNGPTIGNPFTDVKLSGKFINDNDTISIQGFYDGEGIL